MQTKVKWDPDVLEPIFNSLYTTAMKEKKDFLPMMYAMETSTKDTESVDGIGGEGLLEEWGQSGNSVNYEDIDELWVKQFKMRKYSGGRVIERDFVDDLKLTKIKDMITGLADAVYKTRQYQGVETFNNAFVTNGIDFRGRTYNAIGPDGIALCSDAHPYSPTNSVDVQGNKGASPLSWDAWDDTVVAMQEWVDDKGNLMAVMPDCLMVAPYNRAKAFQIAGMPGKAAENVPETANHTINVYNGDISVIVNPFLKNRYNWFAIDKARLNQFHKWFDRRKPSYGQTMDFDTEATKYKVIGRWQKGFTNYSWVYGHEATE
jgi:hypothetical protein